MPSATIFPAIEDNDLVRLKHGADALGDNKCRVYPPEAVAHFRFQRVLDLGFRLHVDGTRRVIQDQDLGSGEERARDGDALFLPPGQVRASGRDTALA